MTEGSKLEAFILRLVIKRQKLKKDLNVKLEAFNSNFKASCPKQTFLMQNLSGKLKPFIQKPKVKQQQNNPKLKVLSSKLFPHISKVKVQRKLFQVRF